MGHMMYCTFDLIIGEHDVSKFAPKLSWLPGSREKFEPISTNPYLSIINRLFNEINRLFLEFLLEIENFIENRSDISLKFFISTGYFQISTGYLITKPRFSLDIAGYIEYYNEAKYFYIHPYYGCKIKFSPIFIQFWLLHSNFGFFLIIHG
jgi:hypothetical protein